jgi:hypothetical protein
MQTSSTAARQIPDTQSWVDQLYQAIGRHLGRISYEHPNGQSPPSIIVVSAICGLTVFAVGFAAALMSGFAGVFLSTRAVYYGAFGIAWVLGWLRWGLLRLCRTVEDIRVCFTDEERFLAIAGKTIDRMNGRTGSLVFALIVFSLGLAAAVLGLYIFVHDASRSRLLPLGWYQGPRTIHLAILIVFGIGCSLPLGTGLYLQAVNFRFLHAIYRFGVVPLPGVLVARFRQLTGFYLVIAGSWFVGVALFALVFVGHLDPFPIFILTTISAFGLVTALTPQLVFHAFITQASSEVAGEFARIFKFELASRIDQSSLPGVTSMLQASQPVQMWVINLKDLLLLGSGQLLPLAAVVVRNRLGIHL